jgi:hypothetical protein
VIAGSLNTLIERAAVLDPMALTGLDEAAALLTSKADEPLAPKIVDIVARATPIRSSTPISPTPVIARPVHLQPPPVPTRSATPAFTPAVTPAAAAAPLGAAPSGAALHDMLGAGISGLSSLGDTPLAEPAELEDDGVVPIQDLLYRGKSALRRAAQLGQSFRTSGSTPNADELAELYDLLELAEAE